MKRRCQHFDVTDYYEIEAAVIDCMAHKEPRQFDRNDIIEYFSYHGADPYKIYQYGKEYNRLKDSRVSKEVILIFLKSIDDDGLDSIVTELMLELLDYNLILKPTETKDIIDKSNGKPRTLTIESIKQQFCDYLAAHGIEELIDKLVGYYQMACRKNYGPPRIAKLVQKWMRDKRIRCGIHLDIKKCYPSITHLRMMEWLKRHVKNDDLLWLISALLNTCEEGLPIGSYLSIKLSALYLSELYRTIPLILKVHRRNKAFKIIAKQLFFLDDIFLFSKIPKLSNSIAKKVITYVKRFGLIIHNKWEAILFYKRKDACMDILGYKVYRNHITMRKRNYKKLRKELTRFKSCPSLFNARSLCARYGMFIKHTNSLRFCRKYNLFKYYKSARKVISQYDKRSTFRLQAA